MVLPVADRLQLRSHRDENGCLIWDGCRDSGGYGVIMRAGSPVKVHRAAWEEANGPIPPGALVCHSCDVRACIEPTHLWLGTYADNNRDCYRKGRHRSIGGWNAGRHHSPETREKIAAKKRAHIGWRHSEETRAKMAAARRAWWASRV